MLPRQFVNLVVQIDADLLRAERRKQHITRMDGGILYAQNRRIGAIDNPHHAATAVRPRVEHGLGRAPVEDGA